MLVKYLALVVLMSGLAGCGGSIDLTCDEARLYETAARGKRIESPDGLDPLNELKEIPLPEASSKQTRTPGAPCIDRPPTVGVGG